MKDDVIEDDGDLICVHCNGSGEGMHAGTTCAVCGGLGVERPKREEYLDDEDRYEDRRYLAQEIEDDDRRAGIE